MECKCNIVSFCIFNPRHACAASVAVVICVCMCLSVKSHLTSGASVRPENTVTYSAGNGGPKGVFSETASFKSYGVICLPTASYSNIAVVFCATF